MTYGIYPMPEVRKSNKLNNVCYDIRGPVLEEAKRLEDEGSRIIKLNIGLLVCCSLNPYLINFNIL